MHLYWCLWQPRTGRARYFRRLTSLACQIRWHGQWPAPTFVCPVAVCRDDRHTPQIKDMRALRLPSFCLHAKVKWLDSFALASARNPRSERQDASSSWIAPEFKTSSKPRADLPVAARNRCHDGEGTLQEVIPLVSGYGWLGTATRGLHETTQRVE